MLETKNHVHRCFTTIPWRSQNTVLSGSLSVHQGSVGPSVHSWSDSLVDARHLHVEQGWPSSLHCQGDEGGKMLTTARSNFTEKLDVITNLVPEQGEVGLGGATGSSTLLLLQGLQTCWADDQGRQVRDFRIFSFSRSKRIKYFPFTEISRLLVFWSKVGDNPERILMTEV